MYLKYLIIKNYRKFGTENNKISFVDSKMYNSLRISKAEQAAKAEQATGTEPETGAEQEDDTGQAEKEINISSTATLIVGKNNAGKPQ